MGHILAKDEDLRINFNYLNTMVDDTPIPSRSHSHPSHYQPRFDYWSFVLDYQAVWYYQPRFCYWSFVLDYQSVW